MSYEQRRKNNVISITYENDFGDTDLFSYDPERDVYSTVRNFDKDLNQMAFEISRKKLPQIVRERLDSERMNISEILE